MLDARTAEQGQVQERPLKTVGKLVLVVLASGAVFYAALRLGYYHVADLRARAPVVLRDAGFDVVSYMGYESSWSGGDVRHVVERRGDAGHQLYVVTVTSSNGEYQIRDLRGVSCRDKDDR